MDIRNSKELITEFISKSNFIQIYSDPNLNFIISDELINFDKDKVIDFLLSSAVAGHKAIGFFKELPMFETKQFVRGDCILITNSLPVSINLPTLFCKELDKLSMILCMAMKLSNEIKLPIIVVISDNVLNNFTTAELQYYDYNRVSGYISDKSFSDTINPSVMDELMIATKNILDKVIPNEKKYKAISFYNRHLPFFNYLLPTSETEEKYAYEINVPEDEYEQLRKLLKNNCYRLKIDNTIVVNKFNIELHDYLCPGCPFLVYFTEQYNENIIYFTDIQCEGIKKKYNIIHTSIESYIGINSQTIRNETVFIGRASAYNPNYLPLLKLGKIILLNNANIKSIDKFVKIKHPKDMVKDVNLLLFPYSCYNIKRYKLVKTNKKACNCDQDVDLKYPICIDKLDCAAISITDKVSINKDLCTGCRACIKVCPERVFI